MLLQKRAFEALKRAVANRKRERQVRTESAIFNFLNIERKGFNMLLRNALERK